MAEELAAGSPLDKTSVAAVCDRSHTLPASGALATVIERRHKRRHFLCNVVLRSREIEALHKTNGTGKATRRIDTMIAIAIVCALTIWLFGGYVAPSTDKPTKTS